MRKPWTVVMVGFILCWCLLAINQPQQAQAQGVQEKKKNTDRTAECQKKYETKMRTIAINYDPKIRNQGNKITKLKNGLETYMRNIKTPPGPSKGQQNYINSQNKIISAEEQTLRKLENSKSNEEKKANENLNRCIQGLPYTF